MNNINKKYKKIALIILIIGFAFLISKNSFLEPIKTLFKNIKKNYLNVLNHLNVLTENQTD